MSLVQQHKQAIFNAALQWRGDDAVYKGFGFEQPIRVIFKDKVAVTDVDGFETEETETYALASAKNLPEFNSGDKLVVLGEEYNVTRITDEPYNVKVKIGLE